MARKTLYLRPCEDISVGHTLSNAEGVSAASLISETVSDEGSTYIYLEMDSGYTYSTFKLDFDDNTKIRKVISASIKVEASFQYGNASHNISIFDENENEVYSIYLGYSEEGNAIGVRINGEQLHPETAWGGITGSSVTNSFDASSLADFINDHITRKGLATPLNLTLEIRSGVRKNDGSKYDSLAELSQAIFELECETGIEVYEKVDGNYVVSTAAYKKHNGIWSEIHEDEAKTILNNNTIRRG